MQAASRTYRVVYDDDLDIWSVVTTPFEGVHFKGTRPLCETFVAYSSGQPRIAGTFGTLAKSYESYIPNLHVSAFGSAFRVTRQAGR